LYSLDIGPTSKLLLKDPLIRAFLLLELSSNPDSPYLRYRIPLPILAEGRSALGGFPYEPGKARWGGKTLFINGTRSK